MELLLIGAIVVIGFIGWCVWRFLTTDWFGIYHEDESSPYYHDKTGQGKGRRN